MSHTSFIFTCREEFCNLAENEVRKIDHTIKTYKYIDYGICNAYSECTYSELSRKIIQSKPIFIRHINPVDTIIELDFTKKDFDKIESEVIDKIIPKINQEKSFSVQTRVLDNVKVESDDYSRFRINNRIADLIKDKTKASINIKDPTQVVSVIISENTAYIGCSNAEDNISNWAGGERRFSKEKEQISRAEFKLLEAIEAFELDLHNMKQALDLGASPGGWTRILRQKYDMRVTAVDPAMIEKSLVEDKKVKHIKKTSQKFFMHNKLTYDVIVNDMKTDVGESVVVMLDAEKYLNPNGIAIMTLKLPSKKIMKAIESAIHKLSTSYELIGAKQLFHNRHEITVVLGKNP